MIEKFSDEELKQIKKELGINTYENSEKKFICRKEITELYALWDNKPCANHQPIFGIIDNTLCNYVKKKKRKDYNNGEAWGTPLIIPKHIEKEYIEMFNEILGVIKKHNRVWESDAE